ncbi:unnamed protein product [Linum tenue]|uniref:Eukaryotic translation initiation factor 5B n=1 Tax=Linum tenue TaxID=586396 RepID=A0AAV0NGH1_9ROSI|nr:unnamed protein product [Linum tenue]
MGRKKPAARDEDNPPAVSQGGGGKSKKKTLVIDDDEYSIGTELSEESQVQEEQPVITGKKKGKKADKKSSQAKLESDDKSLDDEGEDEVPDIVFAGKKKSQGKKTGGTSTFSTSSFGLLGDGDEDGGDEDKNNEDNSEVAGGKDSEEEDESVVNFTGKKKKKPSLKGSKGGGSVFSASAFDAIDDGEEDGEVVNKDDDLEDEALIVEFTGKKKSSKGSKKSGNVFSAAASFDILGKKKSSKKKGTNTKSEEKEDVKAVEEVADTSKNKKKKKKSGRTAQEEDDLDKILAELGEGPSAPKPSAPPPVEEKVQVQSEAVAETGGKEEKDGEEEKEESAAAKKKKKKKEKEKEKKAAAAAASAVSEVKEEKIAEVKGVTSESKKGDAKGKAADKKLPKHVREMQEALARRKELEEKKAREEEEKRRKEEEERLRLEELERQAEEAKRRKKEREKEKLLKKKQEGKLLTGKQKEQQRRLEAMRNQILANNANLGLAAGDKEAAPAKRPIYKTKKTKPAQKHENGAASVNPEEDSEIKVKEEVEQVLLDAGSVEEKVEDVETEKMEEKVEVAEGTKENGVEEEDDDDEEWDAKSWDDISLNVKGAFDDEEVDPEPEPTVKKCKKLVIPAARAASFPLTASAPVAAKTPASLQASKVQDVQSKKSKALTEQSGKKRSAGAKNGAPATDATSEEPEEDLRSPICCIMGHVDTGKTKLLDCIRGTNVQEGEAGGITQQIGATYFPAENIRERTRELKADAKLKVPGLLVIDTPGHESFTNLRSRGSGLCDIAILVVDIMHGLEPQTIESLNLLRMRNTEFIVALNKVDRLYGWKVCRNAPIVKAMKLQSKDVQNEFNMRLAQISTQFQEQGLNTALYYKNKEMGETYSIVPTSAISGEGIPDLLLLLVQWTQKTMVEKLTFSNEIQCTVLEVKVIEGHGTTIDVVLVNGVLHEGDQIVVCGLQGPIVTSIRALLTPHPMKELRVKGTYLHHKEIKAAQGIKITGQGLEHAIAGTGLYVVGPDDDVEDVKESAMEDMKSVMSRIDKSGEGVYVQASTLGSLEALLEFLKSPAVKIPVSGIGIGPVHKKDVMKASVMLEKKKEYATILAFDVKVTPEARELADDVGVTIFIADIIYHLFDQFKAYIDNLKEEKKKEAADEAVFPCVLKIMPNCVFNKKDPIVLGVDIVEGIAKVGTPICIPTQDFIDIGRIASIENNHKPVDTAKKGQKVAIKIIGSNSEEQQKMYGRHFDIDDELVSHISRSSIDILKENYRDELSIDEWKLVVKLKSIFKIQ